MATHIRLGLCSLLACLPACALCLCLLVASTTPFPKRRHLSDGIRTQSRQVSAMTPSPPTKRWDENIIYSLSLRLVIFLHVEHERVINIVMSSTALIPSFSKELPLEIVRNVDF
ncbi:hypothetical protein F4805DRAFT_50913 [Annulohypoxylon moriforme]|nr:hypothetical protein F4805DRAFT_50913 [Annulohypoxylon moriforme]